MHLVRSALFYIFAAGMIVGAYHTGAYAAGLLANPSHAMARPVPIMAEIAERVA